MTKDWATEIASEFIEMAREHTFSKKQGNDTFTFDHEAEALIALFAGRLRNVKKNGQLTKMPELPWDLAEDLGNPFAPKW